jgi:hypothetical protein
MTHPVEHYPATVRYLPGRAAVTLTIAGTAIGWLAALGGLVGTIGILPDLGWPDAIFLVVLGGSSASALWTTRRAVAFRRVWRGAPIGRLEQRRHGDLSAITDSERRPLRPIGTPAAEVAARTDTLLGGLIAIPSVRIFLGVRLTGSTLPLASHAISAGRLLILVESVTWPPGWYRTDAIGRVYCDGQYIGQSIHPLVVAVRRARRLLPRSHHVSALVVVHRTADGGYALPSSSRELAWALGDDVIHYLRERIAHHPSTVSRHTIAALDSIAPQPVVTS